MGKKLLITLSILASIFTTTAAEANVATKLIGFALKPVTIPLNFARRKTVEAINSTAHAGLNATRSGLSHVSIQAGPFISIRPFDYR